MPNLEFSGEQQPNRAVLYMPAPLDPLQNRLFEGAYRESGIAAWAKKRETRHETIKPRRLYVSDDGQHNIAWVEHTGHSQASEESSIKRYTVHHVVCDCAADAGTLSGHPEAVLACDYVQDVLTQRADEISKEQRVGEILSSMYYLDEDTMDFKLSLLGQEMALRAIVHVLETDKRHPEQWMANRITGLHDIDLLATIVRQDTSTVMPLLETMEEGGLVTIRKDKVKLDPNV